MRRTLSLNGHLRNPRLRRTLSLNGDIRGTPIGINPIRLSPSRSERLTPSSPTFNSLRSSTSGSSNSRSSRRSNSRRSNSRRSNSRSSNSRSSRRTRSPIGNYFDIPNDQNNISRRLTNTELENKVSYLLQQYRITNTIPELPNNLSLEDTILIDDAFYNIIKLSPDEITNKIKYVVDEWRITGDIIVIYGIHPRDEHIIYTNALSLIRQLSYNGTTHNRRSRLNNSSNESYNPLLNQDLQLEEMNHDPTIDALNPETFAGGSKRRTYKKR